MIYSTMNKPMPEEQLPSGYVLNVWDDVHNAIAHLYNMLEEVKGLEKRVLSDDLRERLIEQLVVDSAEYTEVEDLLLNGYKGYRNMTDMDLMVDIQSTIAGWCGIEENSYIPEDAKVYDEVRVAADKFADGMIVNAIETSMLDRFEKFVDNGYKE